MSTASSSDEDGRRRHRADEDGRRRHRADEDGRRRHYGEFYEVPGVGDPDDDRPLWLVHGNCQAEALRVLLAAGESYRTVRIPPVHELEPDDVPHLERLVATTSVLLSQPIRADYRDLPLGTDQLAAQLPAGARVLHWPVVRYGGLHPWQVIVRHPADGSLDPPVVPYHDLRTVAAAIAEPRPGAPVPPLSDYPAVPQAFRDAASASIAELVRREEAQTDVAVSDVLTGEGAAAAHTINHPGNGVLTALAERVQRAAGEPVAVTDPGRVLLGGVRAPLDAAVLDALGLTGEPRDAWLVGGEPVDPATVHETQVEFYRADPRWCEAAVSRHADRMALLGL